MVGRAYQTGMARAYGFGQVTMFVTCEDSGPYGSSLYPPPCGFDETVR